MTRKRDPKGQKEILVQAARELAEYSTSPLPASYGELLDDLKRRIREARVRAGLSVNRELIRLHWEVGKSILEREKSSRWGDKVLDKLSTDLYREFPDMKGFSRTNLKYMRMFAQAYPEFGQQPVDQLPWGHNTVLITKVKDPTMRQWYIRACIEHGWSRAVLVHQIESNLYERQGKAVTNFDQALPTPQSDLARELIKDPYNLDFVGFSDPISELSHRERSFVALDRGVKPRPRADVRPLL